MRITRTEVRNYRSIFEHSSTSPGLRLDIADGLNVIVGRNNCGKSNLFRALAAALDPKYQFDPTRDTPGPKAHRYPSIQVWFELDPSDDEEKELLNLAREYEQLATDSSSTRANQNQVVLRVTYAPSDEGPATKRERIVFLDGSDTPAKSGYEMRLNEIVQRLHGLVRFVMISSGESIASVLEGNFREILHTVVQEHMNDEFDRAEEHRQEYIKGLQTELLGPLRATVEELVRKVFPEITDIHLTPTVSDIETTLSKVEIGLEDAVTTPLSQKGTGVRGGVLVAMLQYLAENASKCVVFAVEEPEAFLHPAAQEELREGLESLAARPDVNVLVTTHSPFVISRRDDAISMLLEKDHEGRTSIAAASRGDDQRVAVISGILTEQSLEEVVAAAQAVPSDKRGVLLVEGYGDKHYLELAAQKLGRDDAVADLHIVPSNGCSRMANLAVLMRAATGLPIAILLDNDEAGRNAGSRILNLEDHQTKSKLFSKKDVISYRAVFKDSNFEWEAEDLFDPVLIEEFVDENGGREAIDGSKKRPDNGFHFDLGEEYKIKLSSYLEEHAGAAHCEKWGELLDLIRRQLKLPEAAASTVSTDSGDARTESVETPTQASKPAIDERVLLVSENYGHAEYLRSNVFAGEPGRGISPDVRFIAFYEGGEIRTDVPRVIARHDDLVFDTATADSLAKSKNATDISLASFITDELNSGRRAPGETRQVFLLTRPEDEETIRLSASINNTKVSPKGKPMAWVVRTRMTWVSVLTSGATTTDELDELEEQKK